MRAVHVSLDEVKGALGDSKTQMSSMQGKVQDTETLAQATAEKVTNLGEEFHQMREEWSLMKAQTGSISGRNELKAIRVHIERQELYSRRYNIIIDEMHEPDTETPTALSQKVASFLSNILGLTSMKFDITHRLGSKAGNCKVF